MSRVSTILTNFRAGELSPKLSGRIDLQKYQEGCDTMENMIVFPSGGTTRRPGTYYAGTTRLNNKARLIPFVYNEEAAYVLEFTDGKLRVYQEDAIQTNEFNFMNSSNLLTTHTQVITNITQANPAVVTTAFAHGFTQGDKVYIKRAEAGMSELNRREFTVGTVGSTTTFELNGINSTNFSAFQKTVFVENTPLPQAVFDRRRPSASLAPGSSDPEQIGPIVGKLVEITTPYSESQLDEINFTQSADVLFLVHPDKSPRKLVRESTANGISFTISEIDFVDGPYLDENITSTTLHADSNSGTIQVTASAALFSSGDLGRLIRFREVIEAEHRAWAASASFGVNETVHYEGNVYKNVTSGTNTSSTTPPVHLEGQKAYGNITWEFQHSGSGYVKITQFDSTTVVQTSFENDTGVLPASVVGQSNATKNWSLGSFSSRTGFPRAIAFYEERLYLAGTDFQPQTIFGSVSADFENHTPGTNDDQAINVTIASDQVNMIKHLLPARFLQILTTSAEFTLSGGTGSQPVTPTNVNVLRETTFGASKIRPLRAGNSTILVQRGREKVKEITFDLDTDGLLGVDLTVLADHITSGGLLGMAWQQEPELILWFIGDDGRLIGLTYDRSNGTVGWHKHPLGGKSGAATVTVSDFANIAVGTTITLTKSDGTSVVFTSEAVGSGSPSSALGFKPNTANSTTASNIRAAINSHADFTSTVVNDVLTVREVSPSAYGYLNIATSDVSRLSPTSEKAPIVESIASIPRLAGAEDQIYLAVQKNFEGSLVRHVVTMRSINFGNDVAESFFLDSATTFRSLKTFSGAAKTVISDLHHLEGEIVQILVDGATHPDRTVTNGKITLERSGNIVHVGQHYDSTIKTLRMEAGAADGVAQGKIMRIHAVTVRFTDTVGASLGPDISDLDRITFRDSSMSMDQAVPLFTGDKEIAFPSGYDNNAQIVVQQDQPLPMTITAIMRRSNTFDA